MPFGRVKVFGLTGTWTWSLETNEQVWSPNLCRPLGLWPEKIKPSYDLLYWLIHPDDQHLMPTPCEIAHVVGCPDQIFRIVRPDGGTRKLSSRIEICQAQNGRPLKIIGVLLDMTDQAPPRNAEQAECGRSGTSISATAPHAELDVSDEWIDGGHLRAARGLLDWSMQDLSRASGLSLSTVRRMEEKLIGRRGHSIRRVVAVLCKAGIRFSLIDGATIAVARAARGANHS